MLQRHHKILPLLYYLSHIIFHVLQRHHAQDIALVLCKL